MPQHTRGRRLTSRLTAGHRRTPLLAGLAAAALAVPGLAVPGLAVPGVAVPGVAVPGVATANMELENTAVDIPQVFGPNSPETQQLAADPDSFKDAETADYVGIGVHCARGGSFCANAQGVKFGQGTPSPTAVSDLLPDEPAGYQALFGHRYVAPQLGAGTANVTRNGYQVTNAAGNVVDENGNQLNGAFLASPPASPASAASTRPRRWPTWPTCRSPGSR